MHSFTCEPFNNIVHHGVIEDDGVSFKGRRAEGEERSEFLGSEDRWLPPGDERARGPTERSGWWTCIAT